MAENQFGFYYNKGAFQIAFFDNSEDVVFADDGSVYKGSIGPDNLVISGSGEVGPAGGASTVVKINDVGTGAISNSLEYTRRLSQYLVDQLNLQLATEDFLDFLGKDVFGIPRFGGEPDILYADRIVDTVLSIKCTPNSIKSILRPYSEDVEIIDGGNSGAFADVTFSDYYLDKNSPAIIRSAIAASTGGTIYHFNVILTNPDPAENQKIINLINLYKPAGTTYGIIVQ